MTDIRSELKERLNMDLDRALKELSLPQAAFERVARVSLLSTASILDALDTAITAGDTDAISRGAHELKGVFMNLRFSSLAEPAQQMEVLIKAGASMKDVRRQLEVLRAQYAILKEVFR